MYDINKIIASDDGNTAGDFFILDEWSKDLAQELAREENLVLSVDHWRVILFLRDHYQKCGPCSSGRAVLGLLEEKFAAQGGKKYLYHLFPGGPVVQSCKLAALPLPPYSTDASFGSVM